MLFDLNKIIICLTGIIMSLLSPKNENDLYKLDESKNFVKWRQTIYLKQVFKEIIYIFHSFHYHNLRINPIRCKIKTKYAN